jgi:hypothetical protein
MSQNVIALIPIAVIVVVRVGWRLFRQHAGE